jgi:hypothetical protein
MDHRVTPGGDEETACRHTQRSRQPARNGEDHNPVSDHGDGRSAPTMTFFIRAPDEKPKDLEYESYYDGA